MTSLGIHERSAVKKTVDFFSPILQLYVYVYVQEKVGKLFTQGLDDASE